MVSNKPLELFERTKLMSASEFLSAADQTKAMADQMSSAAMAMPQDPKAAFKAEWESLEIVQHQWALRNVEEELLGTTSHSKTD